MPKTKPGRTQYHTEELVMFSARIPESLAARVELLLVNPQTGKIPYGAKTQFLESLLRRWVEEQIALRAGNTSQPQEAPFNPDTSRYTGKGSPE